MSGEIICPLSNMRCRMECPKLSACTRIAAQPGAFIQRDAGVVSLEPGGKVHEGKPRVYRGAFASFPRALTKIAEVTEKGAHEPGHYWDGWKEVPDGFAKYSDAMGRHLLAEATAESPEALIFQVATTAWNSLARLEHLIKDYEDALPKAD